MNLNKLLIQVSLAIFILISSSCLKGKLVEEYYLTDGMRALNPFKGFENLTYVDDSNTQIVFRGQNRINEIVTYAADDKGLDYVYAEDDYIIFIKDNIQLSISMNRALSSRYLEVRLYYQDKGFIYYSSYDLLNGDNHENYMDSLLINGLWTKDVYYDTMLFMYNEQNPVQLNSYPIKSYYNKQDAVVKIDFSDSTSWELEYIEW